MFKFNKTVLVLSVALAMGAGIVPIANAYDTLTILGSLSKEGESVAFGINNTGQVVGYSNLSYDMDARAVLWNGTTPTVLTGLGGDSSANGINDSGQVVGYSSTFSNRGALQTPHAVLWNSTTPTTITPLTSINNDSSAYGINNSGQVVGKDGVNAVVWNGTTPAVLDNNGSAYGINNSGQVVGSDYSSPYNGSTQALFWNGTTPTALSNSGAAYKINNTGQAVGYDTTTVNGSQKQVAVLWNGTTPTFLDGLGGTRNQAYGINDSGQVVGFSDTGNLDDAGQALLHGMIWSLQNGTMVATDLNSLIDPALGFTILSAQAINNNGQIVGFGRDSIGYQKAFVLNTVAAVPEPGEWLLMLSGLGLIGFIATRRKNDYSNLKFAA